MSGHRLHPDLVHSYGHPSILNQNGPRRESCTKWTVISMPHNPNAGTRRLQDACRSVGRLRRFRRHSEAETGPFPRSERPFSAGTDETPHLCRIVSIWTATDTNRDLVGFRDNSDTFSIPDQNGLAEDGGRLKCRSEMRVLFISQNDK